MVVALLALTSLFGACAGVSMRTKTPMLELLPRLHRSDLGDVKDIGALVWRVRIETFAKRSPVPINAELLYEKVNAADYFDWVDSIAVLKELDEAVSSTASSALFVEFFDRGEFLGRVRSLSAELEVRSTTRLGAIAAVEIRDRISEVVHVLEGASESTQPAAAGIRSQIERTRDRLRLDEARYRRASQQIAELAELIESDGSADPSNADTQSASRAPASHTQ